MRRRSVLLVGALVLAGGVLVLGEPPAASPGALAPSHRDLNPSCRACHAPFRGAGVGCPDCHGGLPAANKHADLDLRCDACHAEHGGTDRALVAHAGQDCTSCHAHPSIDAVERHRLPVIDRPLEVEAHAIAFSHKSHFTEIADQGLPGAADDCQRCHAVGPEAGADAEHALRWSGCAPCHTDWPDAGFSDVGDVALLEFKVFIQPARLGRVRFRHSPGHLQTPCATCHLEMKTAKAIKTGNGAAADVVIAAKRVTNCFGCHAHEPQDAERGRARGDGWSPDAVNAAEVRITACADCHEFHGSGAHGDFPHGAGDTPPAPPWDVWAHVAGVALSPWLLGFLGVVGVGFIAVARRAGGDGADGQQTDPDVAPQRVAEVPLLSPSGESSQAGLFVVGELAGIPLINRAMKSGFDAVDFIANRLQLDGRGGAAEAVDVVIAGAGPAGLGAATKAKSLGLSYVVCEKGTAAATIKQYPRSKIIQAAPIDVPEYGSFFQEDDESKEGLVRRWEDIIARTGVVVNERQQVTGIAKRPDGLFTTTVHSGQQYASRFVILAIGVRGTPRQLGLAGECAERVAYLLIDPEEYREQQILIVGGGNAACEVALALSGSELLNHVTLSHRGTVLSAVTPQNSQAIDAAAREGRIEVIADSELIAIRDGAVVLRTPAGEREIANQFIFAMVGAELPTKFLRALGLKLTRKGG